MPKNNLIEGEVIHKPHVSESKKVILGVENFLAGHVGLIKGKRVGLVTNQSGVNRSLQSTADLLFHHPDINLKALYGPEHGIRGDIFAGHKISTQTDPKTGLTVYSLYGKTRKPTKEMLNGIDVIIFDIQDIGVRSYTFISTMGVVIEAAAENDKEVIILDRPNPIGGVKVEGNIVHDGYFSFIGYFPIAYRHGMTVGEIAKMHNTEKNIGAKLTIIPLKNWNRSMLWNETGLPWIPTSPHVPDWESSLFLAATGTFGELHVLSEGVGYTMPFEFVGAPWIKSDEFATALNNLNLSGIIFRPVSFKPYYFRLKDQQCQGVQLHIIDYNTFDSFTCGLHIMKTTMDLYPDHDLFANKNRISSFNKVMGSDLITTGLQTGKSVDQLEKEWQQELNEFKKIRTKYLLY
ncbi:MAG: DUF1343 domain-containing protein [Calditrichaeota bacterium]|nr:DUF1343 domain-containing protein [Calditrichota bacterium]